MGTTQIGFITQDLLDQILTIEEQNWLQKDEDFDVDRINDKCYTKEEINELLNKKNVVGIVSLFQDNVAAFCIFEQCKDCFNILKIGAMQGDKEGFKVIIDEVKSKIKDNKKRQRVEANIPEELTSIHKMLAEHGFKATGVDKKAETYKFVFPK